jgi:hypothetical protein
MSLYVLFAILVGVAAGAGVLALFHWWWNRPLKPLFTPPPPLEVSAQPDLPISFGFKVGWLAIKSHDPLAVVEALELREVERANWRSGLEGAYRYQEHRCFVTPAVDGWVLAIASQMPSPRGDRQQRPDWWAMMDRLAAKFDDVQYFANHRVVSFVAWGRYRHGAMVRVYCYDDGSPIYNGGERTAEEIALEIPAPEPGDNDSDGPREEDSVKLAAAWSFDVSKLAAMAERIRPGVGWLGRLSSRADPG